MSPLHRLLSVSGCWVLILGSVPTDAQSPNSSLTVVEDRGGVSALPYYQSLHLERRPASVEAPNGASTRAGIIGKLLPRPSGEDSLLPVHSTRLSVGRVAARVIEAPGLTPFFLIGDDDESRAWLHRRVEALRALHAVGFVVEVSSYASLQSLRELAPGLSLAPASGDDVAGRLAIRHYPVLITATGIEQ